MTSATVIERSGPAIRAALSATSPDECAAFEAEFVAAIDRARADLDLTPAESVLDRWWGIAVVRSNALGADEQTLVERARAGDLSGLWERDRDGAWKQH